MADRADHAFGEGVLPGRAWRSENLGEAHALHPSAELATVDAVAIAEEVARRRVIGEGLDDLLRGPRGSGGKARKPCRCQRITVSGRTTWSAFRQACPPPREPNPERAIEAPEPRSLRAVAEQSELLPGAPGSPARDWYGS